ncbi:hypothetical protein CV102_13940 [Natronococcus pandeyae]|uniref:Thioredoxin-like fold domain-containing protein n=1 Tax=Natronococcus pandeyae TaxID=2055836 RepID=A0A8J8Q1Z3_9EURY|nr:hypothetical protein CV102_13940 [Natronococcus pandeyae]
MAPRSRSTRRTFLTVAGVTIGVTAGCTDAGPGGDEESNVADPETLDEDDAEPTDDEDDASEEESAETTDDASDSPTGETNESEETSDDQDESDAEATEEEPDDEPNEGAEDEKPDESALEHPAAGNMAHSPVLGPEPTSGEATLIMFDDPACPACAFFEENAFQELKPHADAGELSIVWRGIPVIADWSDAALEVLWATYERDVDAFWALREYAFEIQESVDSDDEAVDRLLDRLAETTALDTAAIRSEAEAGTYERTLDLDEDAAAQAEIDATPYFFLFRDGEFRTEIRGAEDYRVFKSALEL